MYVFDQKYTYALTKDQTCSLDPPLPSVTYTTEPSLVAIPDNASSIYLLITSLQEIY